MIDLPADLEGRLRFEMLLTELSARFVSVTSETINAGIANAQRQIVEALDLDRSTLGRVEGDERFVVTHSWSLSNLRPLQVWIDGSTESHGRSCQIAAIRKFENQRPGEVPARSNQGEKYVQ